MSFIIPIHTVLSVKEIKNKRKNENLSDRKMVWRKNFDYILYLYGKKEQELGKGRIRMGRVSKRGSYLGKAAGKQTKLYGENRCYKAGIYARLSSAQDKKVRGQTTQNESKSLQSESLEVQIAIAKNFVEAFNGQKTGEIIEIKECYTDLGKTGSNFEREGFLRLLQDIRLGEINCVIVKDLSRFGRNYLEAGNYIEKIFPFLGVRFISVADGFDTGKEGNENQQMVSEIKNLVNDLYAKDFSQKAKLNLKQRREEGSYVGGPPPYGYMAEQRKERRVLVPDENTADIVGFIFETFVETESYAAVARLLNRRQINPPSLYRKTKEVYHVSGIGGYKGWDRSAVERIVKSKTYAGILVQGKTAMTARNEKNRIHKPESDWTVTKDAHEPLVDRELYQKSAEVCQKIQNRSLSHKRPVKGYPAMENIFDSVLYCGVCGRKMTRNSCMKQYADGERVRFHRYFCPNGGQRKVTVCPDSNCISGNELADILFPLIRMEFAVFLNKSESYIEYGRERVAEHIKRAEAGLRETERKFRRFRQEESRIYMDYRSGKLSQKEYAAFKIKQEGSLADLRRQQESRQKETKALNQQAEKYLAAMKKRIKLKSGKELTKDMIEMFVSKIYVYPEKRIEVRFTFTADCPEGGK